VPSGEPKRLTGPGGPPLGALDDFAYPTGRYKLEPGEWLCVVTDGATEAVNPRREFFGTARVAAALSALPGESAPAEVIRGLRTAVADFAEGAEAADDLTLLVLRWRGGSSGR
jgi:serine phosphatase RsbU (regulator of sigma subunit)